MSILNLISSVLSLEIDEKIEGMRKAMLANIILGLTVSLLAFTAILFTGSFFYELLLVENFTSLESKAVVIMSILFLLSILLYFLYPRKVDKKKQTSVDKEVIIEEFINGFIDGEKDEK